MTLELHHFFILTDAPAALAEALTAIGLVEGPKNDHPGQGTANRRFFLPNSTLEILYLRDIAEARDGRACALHFTRRIAEPDASPFGLVVHSADGPANAAFAGWRYHPQYLPDDLFFQVGENSELLQEPLCIAMPTGLPAPALDSSENNPEWSLSRLEISVPVTRPSAPLATVSKCPGVSLRLDAPHLLSLEFNLGAAGLGADLRPDHPLLLRW